jgi:two-component system, OmpR family, sensor histidine kinase TctE
VTKNPTLRRRLLVNMLLPAAALAVALGLSGALMIRNVVEVTHDRVLDGSVLAIAERLAVDEGNEINVDLPPVALGMLESQAHDSIYYSVTYDGALVTGYKDLPLPDPARLPPEVTEHRDAVYRGVPVRLAAQARRVFGAAKPVLVAVAETTRARKALEARMLGALALLECGLLGLVGLLAWHAIGRGLAPLTALGAAIDARTVRGGAGLTPLDLAAVPREALAPAAALNALLARLDQSIGGIRRFTADASHQMRTPLAVLRTHLELIRRCGSATPEGRAALDDIDGATRRLERLLEQLITLARADSGETAWPPATTIDLAAIAAAVVTERAPQALAAGLELALERPERAVPVAADALLAEEILANLIDNAIRHAGRGRSAVVRVRANDGTEGAGGGGGLLEVEDNGPGIPEAERVRVFERFYRVARKGAPQGSGLGLAIVRALADRLGASVALTDACAGTGLLVTVTFRGAAA